MKIAVASGKGGTGKTFVSTNLFYLMKGKGMDIALVDADTEVPNSFLFFPSKKKRGSFEVKDYKPVIDVDKCTYCGVCSEHCNYNAIICIPELQKIKVLKDGCHGCTACSIVCNTGAVTDSYETIGFVTEYEYDGSLLYEGRLKVNNHTGVPVIKKAIDVAGKDNHDSIIIDSPPGTACPFIQTANKADFVILVTEPTPFGLSDLKQAVDTLRIVGKPFAVIVNRCDVGDNSVYEYLEKEKIDLIAGIPYSGDVARYYAGGMLAVAKESSLIAPFESVFEYIKNNI